MASEEAPFLPSKETASDPDDTHEATHQVIRSKQRRWSKALLMHFGLILLYTVTTIFLIISQRRTAMRPPAAIDNLQIQYTSMLFHRLNATPYAGPPSPEIDSAWDALLAPMHISVSKFELERDNQDSVALPESGGYLGWLGVFHELHCIVSHPS